MSLRNTRLAASSVFTIALLAGSAQGVTIATFADPSPGPTPSLFEWNGTTNTLTGGWSGNGLTLQTPGTSAPDYANANFSLSVGPALSNMFGAALFGAGFVEFTNNSDEAIFRIDWEQAVLSSSISFGASDFVGFGVTFSGSILDFPTQAEAFAFAFANPVATATGYTVTASFTSSGDRFIPTPGAASLFAAAGLMMFRRSRKA